MSPALEIRDLFKSYDDIEAVRGVSLSVSPGHVFGLIGPDGAGKTTIMRMAAGLLGPDSGQIAISGLSIAEHLKTVRPMMGYMPQQYSLYEDLSVQENFRFFSGMYGVAKKDRRPREERLLGLARLLDYRKRPAGALSGGMYKKLALACALVHHPRLLLLDEPTNGVDPISRRELWTFLSELVKEGVSVLVSTPYMDEAERCDEVGLLVEGRLIETGRPRELIEAFSESVVEIDVTPQREALTALLTRDEVSQAYTVGKKIHVLGPKGGIHAKELLAFLSEREFKVARIEESPPSFEDVFLHLASAGEEE